MRNITKWIDQIKGDKIGEVPIKGLQTLQGLAVLPEDNPKKKNNILPQKDFFEKIDRQKTRNIDRLKQDLFDNLSSQEDLDEYIAGIEKRIEDIKRIYEGELLDLVKHISEQKKKQVAENAKKDMESKLDSFNSEILILSEYLIYLRDNKNLMGRTISEDLRRLKNQYNEIKKQPIAEKRGITFDVIQQKVAGLTNFVAGNYTSTEIEVRRIFDNVFDTIIPKIIFLFNLLHFYKFELKRALENNTATDEEKAILFENFSEVQRNIDKRISSIKIKIGDYISKNKESQDVLSEKKEQYDDLFKGLEELKEYINKLYKEDEVLGLLSDGEEEQQRIEFHKYVGELLQQQNRKNYPSTSIGLLGQLPSSGTDMVTNDGDEYFGYQEGSVMRNKLIEIEEITNIPQTIKEEFTIKLVTFASSPNINTAEDLFYFLSKNNSPSSDVFIFLAKVIGENKLIEVINGLCNELCTPVNKKRINTDIEKSKAVLLLDISEYIYKLRGENNTNDTIAFVLLNKIRNLIIEYKESPNKRNIWIDIIIEKIKNSWYNKDFDFITNILGILGDKRDPKASEEIKGIIKIFNAEQIKRLTYILTKIKNRAIPKDNNQLIRDINIILDGILNIKDSNGIAYLDRKNRNMERLLK